MLPDISSGSIALECVDWDFAEAKPDPIHNIHPYPAKFISEIPRSLIRNFRPATDHAVMDPFCGSGTTLVEAQRLGFTSIGIDLNPIACLISRVKTTPLPPEFLSTVYDCIYEAAGDRNVTVPEIPNLSHWFSEGASLGLAKLLRVIGRVKDAAVSDHLRLALSSIIVRVSNQESDTRYAAVLKNVVEGHVYAQFKRACRKLAETKAATFIGSASAHVINRNVLDVQLQDIHLPVGLVITSPPYPNAYEYWLYHKYRMWWLGWDPLGVRKTEIGARPHYFRKDPATIEDFKEQMFQVAVLVQKVLVRAGYFCVVIGRSKIHGEEIDNGSVMFAAAQDAGMRLVTRFARTIAPTRKSFNLSHARIKTEDILIFEKP